MVQQTSLTQLRGDFAVSNGLAPDIDGPRVLPFRYTLVAGEPLEIDLTMAEMQGFIGGIQTVYIDNYDGTAGVTLTMQSTNQRVKVEASKARYIPVLAPTPKFTLVSPDAQSGAIFFINVPIAAIEQDVSDSASVVAQLAAILAELVVIDGRVDGIEALVTSGNAIATLIADYTDGIEALITATNVLVTTGNATLVAIDGHVDGIETLVASTNTKLDTVIAQTEQPNAGGRLLTTAATQNPTSVKAAPGKVFSIVGKCNAAAAIYLKLYDTALAPTSAMTPVFTFQLDPGVNFALDFRGQVFASGIAYRITGAAADADATNLAAGDVTCLNIGYR